MHRRTAAKPSGASKLPSASLRPGENKTNFLSLDSPAVASQTPPESSPREANSKYPLGTFNVVGGDSLLLDSTAILDISKEGATLGSGTSS